MAIRRGGRHSDKRRPTQKAPCQVQGAARVVRFGRTFFMRLSGGPASSGGVGGKVRRRPRGGFSRGAQATGSVKARQSA